MPHPFRKITDRDRTMKSTDIFIRRPVLACVVSLMILMIGYKAFASLPILEYPKTENAVVTVTTTYYGADPQTVAGFVTVFRAV